jgi:integrase
LLSVAWACLEAAKGDRLQVLYLLAIHTGLRRGELLGLKWGDVDPDRGTLQVQRTLSAAKEGPTFTTLKTTRVAACGSRRKPYKPLDQAAYDRRVAAARAQLDEGAYDAALTEGRSLTFEQAVAYALADDETLPATP